MANKLGNWNLDEFITFLLIYASYADLEYTEEESKLIKGFLSEEDYNEVSNAFDKMGDYETVETILSYKGIHYPTMHQKQELLGRMMHLFESDGDFSKLEKRLFNFFGKLL